MRERKAHFIVVDATTGTTRAAANGALAGQRRSRSPLVACFLDGLIEVVEDFVERQGRAEDDTPYAIDAPK